MADHAIQDSTTLSDFSATTLAGGEQDLSAYAGDVVLVVNTASRCGLTPQYESLERLQEELGGDGFVVLGFPCNQFGGQEPGTAEEIGEFCRTTYGVSFPLFAKIEVNGPGTHPLYRWLKGTPEDPIAWNFTKFLLGRDGRVVGRYAPQTPPEDVRPDIETALAQARP